MAGHPAHARLARALRGRPDPARLRHRLPAGQSLRRHRRRLDPRHRALALVAELPGHRLADALDEPPDDGPLPRPGPARRIHHRPGPGEMAEPPADARRRPVLDELPRPRLRLEIAPPPRRHDQEGPRGARARRAGDDPPLSPGGRRAGHGLHVPAVHDPAHLRRRGEVRLPARRGRPRPRRPPVPGLPQGLPARHPAGRPDRRPRRLHPRPGLLHHPRPRRRARERDARQQDRPAGLHRPQPAARRGALGRARPGRPCAARRRPGPAAQEQEVGHRHGRGAVRRSRFPIVVTAAGDGLPLPAHPPPRRQLLQSGPFLQQLAGLLARLVRAAVPVARDLGGAEDDARRRRLGHGRVGRPGNDGRLRPPPLRGEPAPARPLHAHLHAARRPRDPHGHQPAHGLRRRRRAAGPLHHLPGPRHVLRELRGHDRPRPAPGLRLLGPRGRPRPRGQPVAERPQGPHPDAHARHRRRGPARLHAVGRRLRHHLLRRRARFDDPALAHLQHDQVRRAADDQRPVDAPPRRHADGRPREPAPGQPEIRDLTRFSGNGIASH
ncbi:MAG: hypothetical protein MZV64_11415 [Ignavibacteriales bacterium]|nr:hypothetical protein [Ignavibacteriales bacterium]